MLQYPRNCLGHYLLIAPTAQELAGSHIRLAAACGATPSEARYADFVAIVDRAAIELTKLASDCLLVQATDNGCQLSFAGVRSDWNSRDTGHEAHGGGEDGS